MLAAFVRRQRTKDERREREVAGAHVKTDIPAKPGFLRGAPTVPRPTVAGGGSPVAPGHPRQAA